MGVKTSHTRWASFCIALLLAGAASNQSPLYAQGVAEDAGVDQMPRLDTERGRMVEGIRLEHGGVSHILNRGEIYPIVADDGVEIGVVFMGDGRLEYTPENGADRMALGPFFPVTERIDRPFRIALLWGDVAKTLPQEPWGSAIQDPARAKRAFDQRMELYARQWALQNTPQARVEETLPTLPFDLKMNRDGVGFSFIDCNARPVAYGLPVTVAPRLPHRWWMSWYHRADGVWPLAEDGIDGVLFTHGPTRAGYRSAILAQASPRQLPAIGEIQGQTITFRVDGLDGYLLGTQVVRFKVENHGGPIRLPLLGAASRTLGGNGDFEEAFARVISVQNKDGTSIPFASLNGELLFTVDPSKGGEFAVSIEGRWPMRLGMQAHGGPFELWSPLPMAEGADIEILAPKGYQHILLYGEGAQKRQLAPAVAIGRYIEGHYENQDGQDYRAHLFESPGYAGLGEKPYDRRQLDYAPPILRVTTTAAQRANILAMDMAKASEKMAEILGPLPWRDLEMVQFREVHPQGEAVELPGWVVLGERILYPQGDESFGQLDYQFGLAQGLLTQYFDARMAPGSDWQGEWVLEGLKHALAGLYLERALPNHPSLSEFLDRYLLWAENLDGAVPRIGGPRVAHFQAQEEGAIARGYLLFTQLRYQVGDAAFLAGIQALLAAHDGQFIEGAAFFETLEAQLGAPFTTLFAEGVAQAPYRGRATTYYRIDGSTLYTALEVEEAGPVNGSVLRLTFEDLSRQTLFLPVGQGISKMQFDHEIRQVEMVERGGGLARWLFLMADPNLK